MLISALCHNGILANEGILNLCTRRAKLLITWASFISSFPQLSGHSLSDSIPLALFHPIMSSPPNYHHCHIYVRASKASKIWTLKMATAMLADKLEDFQHSTLLNSEGRSHVPIFFSESRIHTLSGFCYSWTSEPKQLHHTLCRQPWGWKVLGLQRGILYEVSRDRRT
jgi:hypothetical protein